MPKPNVATLLVAIALSCTAAPYRPDRRLTDPRAPLVGPGG